MRARKVQAPHIEGIIVFELADDPGPHVHFDLMSSSGRLSAPLLYDGRRINVETASLDISQDDFLRAAKEFARGMLIGAPQ